LIGPPLAYSLPAFHPHDWHDAARSLEMLRELGFRHVVFHPTWSVSDDLRIGAAPDAAQPVREARRLGFRVRLEPHLDYRSSLNGGKYRWRRDMLINPVEEYYTTVLIPMAELEPDELTLGSELDFSTDVYAEEWELAADRLRGVCALGHKLNHDWLGRDAMLGYLRSLDYIALSWYVAHWYPLPEGYVIGEMGLGSSDVKRPWHFDASTLRTSESLAVRREWYLRRLRWLAQQKSPRAACLWTAGQFDVLGIMHAEWRDEAVAGEVRAYLNSVRTAPF
jgi:hypothetical protein